MAANVTRTITVPVEIQLLPIKRIEQPEMPEMPQLPEMELSEIGTFHELHLETVGQVLVAYCRCGEYRMVGGGFDLPVNVTSSMDAIRGVIDELREHFDEEEKILGDC